MALMGNCEPRKHGGESKSQRRARERYICALHTGGLIVSQVLSGIGTGNRWYRRILLAKPHPRQLLALIGFMFGWTPDSEPVEHRTQSFCNKARGAEKSPYILICLKLDCNFPELFWTCVALVVSVLPSDEASS